MRKLLDKKSLQQFMQELAKSSKSEGKVYFSGGTTALLLGLRNQTIDIDIRLDPEPQGVFEAIADLKNKLDINIELASPTDFIPAVENWREKSIHIETINKVEFFHFDLVGQALSKIERGHTQDIKDVKDLIEKSFVSPDQLLKQFQLIKPNLIRYPAIDSKLFEKKILKFLESIKK